MIEFIKALSIVPVMFVALTYFFTPYLYKTLWNIDDMLQIPPYMYIISFTGLIFLLLLFQFNAG